MASSVLVHSKWWCGEAQCLRRTESTTRSPQLIKSKTKDSLEPKSSAHARDSKKFRSSFILHSSGAKVKTTPLFPWTSTLKPWSSISRWCHFSSPWQDTSSETGAKCRLLMRPVTPITPLYNGLQAIGRGLRGMCVAEALAAVRWLSSWDLEVISGSWKDKFHGDLPSSTSSCSNMLLKKQPWNSLREGNWHKGTLKQVFNSSIKLFRVEHHALVKAEGLGLLCRCQE